MDLPRGPQRPVRVSVSGNVCLVAKVTKKLSTSRQLGTKEPNAQYSLSILHSALVGPIPSLVACVCVSPTDLFAAPLVRAVAATENQNSLVGRDIANIVGLCNFQANQSLLSVAAPIPSFPTVVADGSGQEECVYRSAVPSRSAAASCECCWRFWEEIAKITFSAYK